MDNEKFERIFNPRKIAVIGASSSPEKVGYSVFKNLLDSKFDKVFPVNIRRKKILGKKAYKSVLDINEKIDLVVIATPAETVVELARECSGKGVSGLVIVSSGFKEIGKKGERLCKDLLKIAHEHDMRIMGPNCLGFIRPSKNLNVSFSGQIPLKGNIAFISQSGALGTAILDWAIEHNLGFSFFASIGSMIDLGFNDLIDYLGNDSETTSIVIYMESLENARKFLSAARAFSRNKPIVVLKSGRSLEGAKAALSHTGNLAGNDEVFEAAFKRAGIVRVEEIDDLFNAAKVLSRKSKVSGNRLAIITNAGGPGVIATDSLIKLKGKLSELDRKTISELDRNLPENWSKGNPVDVLGDAEPKHYKKALELSARDKNVDCILVILTPQAMTDSVSIARSIVKIKTDKPIISAWMGGDVVKKSRKILEKGGIPVFRTPEEAVRSFMNSYKYSKNLEDLYQTPGSIPHAFKPKTEENMRIIRKLLDEKRFVLDNSESKKILANYGIPVSNHGLAKNSEQAVRIAEKIGFPVAMKIASPDILHKTEIEGVKLNVNSKKEVLENFKKIIKNTKEKFPKAKIHGVLIEEMASKKYELLIGCKKDPIFGPSIVFGMGGIAVNIFKDINVGLPPLNMALSQRLIEETKIYKLLKGFRGVKSVDIKSIQFVLYKFAYLVADFPEIKEIDINPFSVDEHGGVVLDAKIILDDKVKKPKPYSHLVISPYPKEYIKEFKMKNNKKAVFRPIRPEDEPLEAEMFKEFSKETQRFRFFGFIKDITHDLLTRYTQIDYDREIAIIAEIDDGKKKMAGVVRLISDPYSNNAEFAIVVADPYQEKGLGNGLTDYMIEIARKRGIKKIYAYFLSDNDIVRHIFEKRGFKIFKDEKAYRAELSL
ncbi:GNAT family N-acetyltransferase [Candidatus Pacearchaeota archaeon]|nr:GNAT family N-acetyltransferase [Candidatus Pacearchaeota archaeon]MBD3283571.1 GNAT family N-acetyltransferase [Candidatus Pacearchaeota archaeon]